MAGLSAGGDITFRMGLKHTDVLSQFGLMSSNQLTAANVNAYPFFASAEAAKGKIDLFWMSYGTRDPNHIPADAFDAGLTKNGVPHTYVTHDGDMSGMCGAGPRPVRTAPVPLGLKKAHGKPPGLPASHRSRPV